MGKRSSRAMTPTEIISGGGGGSSPPMTFSKVGNYACLATSLLLTIFQHSQG